MGFTENHLIGEKVKLLGYSNLSIGKLRRGKVGNMYDLGNELTYHTDRVSAFDIVDKDTWSTLEETSFRLFEFYGSEAKKAGIK